MKIAGFVIFFVLLSSLLSPPGFCEEGDSISLEDCIRFAVYNSFEVKLARLDLYIAETDLMYEEAVYDTLLYGGAEYSEDKSQELSVFAPDDDQTNKYYAGVTRTLPTGTELTAEIEDKRSWDNSGYISKNPAHTAELKLEAKQPVGQNIFGYVDRATISLTKLAIKNADLETKDRIESLIAKVEKAYWDLVFAKRSLEIYKGMLERAEELREVNKKNYDMGLAEKVDLLASEANVAAIAAEVLVVENSYRRAEENLKLAMNQNGDRRVVPAEGLTSGHTEKPLSDCLKEAFQKRRDYRIAARDVEIKGLNLKIKNNEKWPEIDLTATMAMNGAEMEFEKAMGKTTVADNTYYYAGVEVSYPLENREARSKFNKAKYEKESALIKLKETERAIITEVGNAFRDVITYEAGLVYVMEAVKLQSVKLEEEEKRFTYGRSNTKRLIDYQNDLLAAELEEAQFLLDCRRARVELARKINATLDKYEDVL